MKRPTTGTTTRRDCWRGTAWRGRRTTRSTSFRSASTSPCRSSSSSRGACRRPSENSRRRPSRRSSGRGRSSSGSASATRSSTRARPPGGRRRRQSARDISRTTPGTAAPERRSSISRERPCARSRTSGISSVRRSPGSPASWTPAAGSSRSRGPTSGRRVTGTVRRVSAKTAWTRWGFWIPRAVTLAGLAVLIFGLVAPREGAPPTLHRRPRAALMNRSR